MKINKLVILSIFLLAIFAIGCVSAADNVTSDELATDIQEEISADDEVAIDLDDEVTFDLDDESEDAEFDISIPYGVNGDLSVKINGSTAGLSDFDEYDEEGSIYIYLNGHQSSLALPFDDDVDDDADYTISFSKLDPGIYNLEVNFKTSDGTPYTKISKVTLTGEGVEPSVDEVVINLDDNETFVLGDEDVGAEFDISIPYGVNGDLSVKINGSTAGLSSYEEYEDDEDSFIYIYLSGHESSVALPFDDDVDDDAEYSISLSKLDPGKYTLEVTFKTSDGTIYTKTSNVTLLGEGEEIPDETIEIEADEIYLYNNTDNRINITAPAGIIDNLDIKINDRSYSLNKTSDTGGYIDISKLEYGEYTITVTYGEEEQEETFEVVAISFPESIVYGSENYVALNAPVEANGILKVTIDDEIVLNSTLENGVARVLIPELSVGAHNILVQFEGTNHEIEDVEGTINVDPKYTCPNEMTAGEDKYLTIDVGDASGVLKVIVDYVTYAEVDVNGTAKISLKDLDDEEYHIEVVFYGNDYYVSEEDFEITVKPAAIKMIGSNVKVSYTNSAVFKVTVYGTNAKLAAYDVVDSIKIGSKFYDGVSIDKNGVAKVKIPTLKPGKYTIITTFEGVSIKNTLTVNHIVKLNTVKVKKSAKKIVIKATVKKGKTPVKNKKVTFKFKGKKYVVKTNKKGVAKVTIKKSVLQKLKVGKKLTYQATYLKDTVKKTVKVKK